MLVPRAPIGRFGLPDNPSFLFSPMRCNTYSESTQDRTIDIQCSSVSMHTHRRGIKDCVQKLVANKLRGRRVYYCNLPTFMRMSWGARILMGSTCLWVCVGMPWVARMACSLHAKERYVCACGSHRVCKYTNLSHNVHSLIPLLPAREKLSYTAGDYTKCSEQTDSQVCMF